MNKNTRKNPLVFLLAILAGMLLTQCECQEDPSPTITDEMIEEATKGGKEFLATVLRKLQKKEEIDINEPNSSDDYHRTALHDASELGSIDIVKALVARGADTEVKDDEGCTPLHLAAGNGHLEVVKLLIARGADIGAKGSRYGYTPLHLAAGSGHLEVVKLLVARGADTEVKDNEGYTPLQLAKKYSPHNKEEIIKLLR